MDSSQFPPFPASLFYILFCQRNELKSHITAQSSFSAQVPFAVKVTGFSHSHHVPGKILSKSLSVIRYGMSAPI